MSFLPSPIACDICKTIKTPSNHWFYSDVVGGAWEIHEWDSAGDDPKNEFTHLCGQVCAVKALSAWMRTMKTCATQSSDDTLS